MDIEQQVSEVMEKSIATIFRKDATEVAANHGIRMREDLGASSKHYFPLIADIEDAFGIMIDYHMFQYEATTVQSAIDYIASEYRIQKGI